MSTTLSVLAVLLAFLVGSLPIGQAMLARVGLNAQLNSAHNLGLSNLLFRAGTGVRGLGGLALASLPDVLKSALPVLLASGLHRPAVTALVGLAAYAGHLYAPLRLTDTVPRGRGTFVLIGIVLALAGSGTLPGWGAGLVVAVSLAVLATLRYTSVAILSGLLTLTATALSVGPGMTLAALGLLLTAAWRMKEQFGRVLDGTEPRLGEQVPMAGRRHDEVVAAFMIHPLTRDHLWQAPRLAWLRPLVERGLVPDRLLSRVLRQVRPMKVGELTGVRTPDGVDVRCFLISVPLLPEVFHEDPALATRRAIQGARLAQQLGASVFGLGSFWSVVGNKGLDVQEAVPGLTVTNGGAFTSGTVQAAIPGILRHFAEQGRDLRQVTAAVVGANGVVAFGIARTIAPQVGKVILLGRDAARLERSANTLRRAVKSTEITTTTSYDALREADLIFTATSDPDPVIFPQHVRSGTWIFDEGRPADVDGSVAQVPGVRVIPGGVVCPPGAVSSRIDLQFGKGQVPACLAETLIIAATGEHGRKSLGPQTLTENVQFFVREAQRLQFDVVE